MSTTATVPIPNDALPAFTNETLRVAFESTRVEIVNNHVHKDGAGDHNEAKALGNATLKFEGEDASKQFESAGEEVEAWLRANVSPENFHLVEHTYKYLSSLEEDLKSSTETDEGLR